MILGPNLMPILAYNKAICKYFCGARDLMPILQMRKLMRMRKLKHQKNGERVKNEDVHRDWNYI